MKHFAILITADGEVQKTVVHQPITLEEIQEAVQGHFESVPLGVRMRMLVNEEGLILGLPTNDVASCLYGARICGNALICMQENEDLVGFDAELCDDLYEDICDRFIER